ncbi:MAG TPA: AI-2E family transporter [Acidimicrobiales bacterium]|nr:AI-2E family transporter [Acidimicrobiales bacterium]
MQCWVIVDDDDAPSGRPETLTARMLEAAEHHEVPLRTIVVTVAVVVAAGLLLALAWIIRTDLILFGVAIFLAVLLAGPVGWLQRYMRRSFATAIVFFTGLALFSGIVYLFGSPLVSHLDAFANNLPVLVQQAEHGQGWVGHLINRLHLHNWVVKNAPKLDQLAGHLANPALQFGAAAASTIFKVVTILMLTYFLLLDLPRIWRGTLSLLPEPRSSRVARVAHEASLGVTGYMAGNIATSIVAGFVVFVSMLAFGVPFAGLLGLWAAIVDLLPIIGGLLAFVPAVLLALLHSPSAGIGVAVICVIYWQVENHVLNPIVMSRTVKMSKLLILVAVVIGATLGGQLAGAFGTFVGALVGIPVGSAIQVIVREVRREDAVVPNEDTVVPDEVVARP